MGKLRNHSKQPEWKNKMVEQTNGWCVTKHKKHKKRAIILLNGIKYCKQCACQNSTPADRKVIRGIIHAKKKARPKRDKEMRRKLKLCGDRIRGLRERATPAERRFRGFLCHSKIKFKFQRAFIKKGGFVIADFYLPQKKLVIEIDGGYHLTPAQQSKDKWKDRYLKDNYGIDTMRFTNERVFEMHITDAQKAIESHNAE
jgi:very-short-patch-repair endonuclease